MGPDGGLNDFRVGRMDFNRKFFREYWKTHVLPRKGPVTRESLEQRAVIYDKIFGPLMPDDKRTRILDLGCGTGHLLWWLQQRGYTDTWGVDISEDLIAVAQAAGVENTEVSDIAAFLESGQKTYDVIVLRDVLEHFSKSETMSVLERCYQALAKGGRLIVQVPNAQSPFFGNARYGDFTHETSFTESSLGQVLSVTGFSTFKALGNGPVLENISVRSLVLFLARKLLDSAFRFMVLVWKDRRLNVVSDSMIGLAFKKDDCGV